MNVTSILNTIRANNSSMYQERVPELTQANLEAVGNAILSYEAVTNEFLSALVNRIAFTHVSNRRYKNPLAILKQGGKPYGTDVEEIFTNPVSAVTFNGSDTEDMLKVTKPDVKTIYHRMNRQDKYPVSISTPQLQKAFKSFGELEKFISSIITAMYSGDDMDEYILMRNLVSSGIAEGKIKTLEVVYTGDENTSKDLIKLLKTLSANFGFQSAEYNGYNSLNADKIANKTLTPCVTWCPKENQVILIRSDVDANTDVEVLAKAFNMDKTDFLKRKIVVDSFGDPTVLAFLCDESAFQVYDDLYTVRSFDNGSNLTTNYWLHHWQTISLSLFANGVAIRGVEEITFTFNGGTYTAYSSDTWADVANKYPDVFIPVEEGNEETIVKGRVNGGMVDVTNDKEFNYEPVLYSDMIRDGWTYTFE